MKNRLLFIPPIAILFILFIVGTFCDFQISSAIANVNFKFSNVVAGLCIYPLSAAIAFIGATFIKIIVIKRYKLVWQNILIGLFGVVCIAFSTFLFGDQMKSVLAFNFSSKFLIPVGLIASIPGSICGYFLFKYVDNKEYVKKILYLAVVLFVSFGIIWVLKKLAPRARYISIVTDERFKDCYRPWYKPNLGKEMIDLLKSTYLGKEAVESFPSGHSSSGILTMILISSLPMFIDKLKNKQTLMFYIGFAYFLIVAFFRFICGAHFVSDITFAGLTNLAVYFVGNEIYLRKLAKE